MNTRRPSARTRQSWVVWLIEYGLKRFLDDFIRVAQDARSVCVHCYQPIFLDVIEGGGTVAWRTRIGDYGCRPTGSHAPERKPR